MFIFKSQNENNHWNGTSKYDDENYEKKKSNKDYFPKLPKLQGRGQETGLWNETGWSHDISLTSLSLWFLVNWMGTLYFIKSKISWILICIRHQFICQQGFPSVANTPFWAALLFQKYKIKVSENEWNMIIFVPTS